MGSTSVDPNGLVVVPNHPNEMLYTSDGAQGRIYQTNLTTLETVIWKEDPEFTAPLAEGLGINGIHADPRGEHIYYVNSWGNRFPDPANHKGSVGRVPIMDDLTAGPVEVLAPALPGSPESESVYTRIFFNPVCDELYITFSGRVEADGSAVAGHQILVVDMEEFERTGEFERQVLLDDPQIGAGTELTTGFGFGFPDDRNSLYINNLNVTPDDPGSEGPSRLLRISPAAADRDQDNNDRPCAGRVLDLKQA